MKLNKLYITMLICLATSNIHAESLLKIYQQALDNDPKLQKIITKVDESKADKNIARADILPQIGATATYGSERIINHSASVPNPLQQKNNLNTFKSNEVQTIGVGFHQEIINIKAWKNYNIAERKIGVAQVAKKAANQELILRVTSAYINILKAIDEIKLIQAEQKAINKQLQNVNDRFKIGMAKNVEQSAAEAESYDVLARKQNAQSELANTIEELYSITNYPITSINQLDINKFKVNSGNISIDNVIEQAQQHNLVLNYNKMMALLSKEGIKLAQTGHLPTLSFDANIARVKQGTAKMRSIPYDNPIDSSAISLNLTIPIYQSGKTLAETDKQRASYKAATIDYESEYRNLVKEVNSTVNNLKVTNQNIIAYSKAKNTAQKGLNAVNQGYDIGINTIDEVLTRIKSVYEIERKLSEARYNNLLLQYKLKLLDGSLTENYVTIISNLFNQPLQLNSFFQ